MRHAYFSNQPEPAYPICVLIPEIRKSDIEDAYIRPHLLNPDEVLVLDLHQKPGAKKVPMAEMNAYIEQELVPVLTDMQVEYLLVADAEYFKALTKAAKVEVHLGYVMDCVWGPWKVLYVPAPRQIFYDPGKVKAKIATAIGAMLEHRRGHYQAPGASIIQFAAYPVTPEDIEDWLERLIARDEPLTCDIEGFSLKHYSAGIGTITFCWSRHEGIAFPVDLGPNPTRVRALLKSFFLRFTQKLIYHSIGYDVYVLIYQLFMKDILDTEGLLEGLEVMLRHWDDTKLIAYLATNSCAGNDLSLKSLAQEFAGNWAVEEIKDITKVPLPELLQYNLVDGLSTWFVHEKYEPVMIADQQQALYEGLFKDAQRDIIQTQLTGMPVNKTRAVEVHHQLAAEQAAALHKIMNSPLVRQFTDRLRHEHVAKRNAALKKKQISFSDPEVAEVEFNPNSDPQMRALLFDFLGLPVINLTDSKLPSTDGETIEALLNRVTDPQVKDLLEAIQLFAIIGTLTTNFMPAILGAVKGPDGWHYLFGNFNLGGTVSGRLSSSKPNLQNLPSTGKGHPIKLKYAKMIKSCFQAPPGWLFLGIDFSSLEDRISALTTKDPNKLKVYTDGYDGHSLRAYAYFKAQMPDIRQSESRRAFTVQQDGQTHYLLEGDEVQLSDGSIKKIEEIIDVR